jgi:hypothetical protein
MSRAYRVYDLNQAVKLYCHLQFNDAMRNHKHYMVTAAMVWEELFKHTLWNFQTMWLEVQAGKPYPYVMLPDGVELFIGLFDEVEYSNGKSFLIPLTFNNNVSTNIKPELKACSCTVDCGCGTNCLTMNELSLEEIEHTIDGDIYIERKWMETCKNGDVIEWREMPTKVYTTAQAAGEFSAEFSPAEFDTDGSGYDIDKVTIQRRICTLKTKECGCIDESQYNNQLINQHFDSDGTVRNFMFGNCCTATRGETYLRRSDDDPRKIFIIGKVKKQYYLKFQQLGASENSPVPEYALMALWQGIEHYSSAFNPSVSDKESPYIRYGRAKINLIKHLNPVSQRTLDILQTSIKKI